jgi:hypothetical protein
LTNGSQFTTLSELGKEIASQGDAETLGETHRQRRAVTIVHGDAHVWNCFLPRDGGSDVRLLG